MPYYITQTNPECNGNWGVEKENGDLIGCHDSKQSAIDQAVAISIDEGTEFIGERAAQSTRALPDNYRPALAEDVPEGRACGNCFFYDESRVNPEGDKAYCEKWDEFVDGAFYCNAWQPGDEERVEAQPAPESEQVEGSDENDPGSAQGTGGDITFSEATETGLRNKVTEHNDKMEEDGKPRYTRTTYGQLAAVYRRGSGAYSTSHRPGISRAAWSMARVNAFLYLLRNGNPENPAYTSDNDLLPEGHPRSTRSADEVTTRDINQEAPAYMRAAARRGLEFYEEGLAGDGVTPGTIREARLMATGEVSDDKWIRISAWIARHLVDLDAPDADPSAENYPSAGVVAHLLWGSGPSKRAAQRTKDYADSVVARIRQEETNSMDNRSKWLKIANAIKLRIDGPESKEPEQRTNNTSFEVRAEADGMTFTGYASVFNSPSEDLGGFVEYVAPGAFKRSLQSRNEVKLLWNHDSGEPLASLRGGTMSLVEDERGLKVSAQLPNTTRGRDIAELLRTKVIDSMSFGFNVIRDAWSNNGQTRTLESVRLFEVSIVSFPAYGSTTAQVRSSSINADQLADGLLKLESGEELDEATATLITDVVNKLKAQPEIDEVIDSGLDLLDLKKKQFDLLLKRI